MSIVYKSSSVWYFVIAAKWIKTEGLVLFTFLHRYSASCLDSERKARSENGEDVRRAHFTYVSLTCLEIAKQKHQRTEQILESETQRFKYKSKCHLHENST